MTREEIIDGLKFTKNMFLFDPTTGDILTKERLNEEDKTTVEACEGAIELLEQESCEDAIDIEIEALDKEPCEDAISRKALIEEMGYYPDLGKKQRREIIDSMPSVTPMVHTGKWLETEEERGFWKCSICEKRLEWRYNFCPDCGADMREE